MIWKNLFRAWAMVLSLLPAATAPTVRPDATNTAPSAAPTTAPRVLRGARIRLGPTPGLANNAPDSTSAGGARGPADPAPLICILSPRGVGTTLSPKPVVYWYLSRSTRLPVHLALNRNRQPRPVFQCVLDGEKQSGFHAIDFAREGISLEPNQEYELVIALRPAADDPSLDAVSSGFLQLVVPDRSAAAVLSAAAREDRPYLLAEEGIWYDSLSELFSQLAEHPDDSDLVDARQSLLRQASLNAVAESLTRTGARADKTKNSGVR